MLLLFILLWCMSSVFCVKELTESDFEEAIKKHKNVLVEFYTPWCTACKAFEPMYGMIEAEFIGEKNILIARVDAEESKSLADKYEVEQYPTMWLFTGGSTEGMEYLGDLDEQSVINFVLDDLDTSDDEGSGHKDDFSDDDSDDGEDDESDFDFGDDEDDDDDDDGDDDDADWKKMQDDIDHMNDVLKTSSAKKDNTTVSDTDSYRRGHSNTTTTTKAQTPLT